MGFRRTGLEVTQCFARAINGLYDDLWNHGIDGFSQKGLVRSVLIYNNYIKQNITRNTFVLKRNICGEVMLHAIFEFQGAQYQVPTENQGDRFRDGAVLTTSDGRNGK